MGSKKQSTEEVSKEVQEEVIKLSPQEQQAINTQRALAKKREACVKEVEEVLIKFGAKLTVSPDSTLRNPQIVVVL